MEPTLASATNGSQAVVSRKVSQVDAATYCQLAVSSRRLERFRESPATYGLRDLETGEQYVVDAKVLRRYTVSEAV